MRNLFSIDGGLARFLTRLADLMILNVTFLIFCIPIVTIGPALCGLHYVGRQMAAGEESYIIKKFWKSFKENFKQATVIWIIMAVLAGILGCDLYILSQMSGIMIQVCRVLICMFIFLWLLLFLFVFPVLARFENTIKNTIKNAFFMAIADFPRAFLMLLILVGSVFVGFLNQYTLAYAIMIFFCFGFSLLAFIFGKFFQKIFSRYIPEEENKDPDNWTLQ